MARTAPAKGSIESWLRTSPKPIYADDPHKVLAAAHDLYGLTTADPVDYSTFKRHLFNRGLQPSQVGLKCWLTFGG